MIRLLPAILEQDSFKIIHHTFASNELKRFTDSRECEIEPIASKADCSLEWVRFACKFVKLISLEKQRNHLKTRQ